MTYAVKEIFPTLQGEGAHAGRVAVFLRFSGCNLWSGLEADREKAACRFCDTDFRGVDGPGGGKFADAASLAEAVAARWPHGASGRPFVVCTGGEPLLQLEIHLTDALHARGFEIAVETNGTVEPPAGIDWLCVSPKTTEPLRVARADELKLVYPQEHMPPERFTSFECTHRFLQPKDGPNRAATTQAAVAYCMAHPEWRLSLQTHKLIGIP